MIIKKTLVLKLYFELYFVLHIRIELLNTKLSEQTNAFHTAGKCLDFCITRNRTGKIKDIFVILSALCNFVNRERQCTITLQSHLSQWKPFPEVQQLSVEATNPPLNI